MEYLPGHFECILHVRRKYACPARKAHSDSPQMETEAKLETAIEKGMAGPGLPDFIVSPKFAEYLPLYRLEDVVARRGFEVPRASIDLVKCSSQEA